MVLPFVSVSPLRGFRWRVRKETKNAAGKNPPPDSDLFNVRSFYGNPSGFVYSNFYVGYRLTIGYRLRDLPCMFNSLTRANRRFESKTQSVFHLHTMKRFPSSRCASAVQIVRPLRINGWDP